MVKFFNKATTPVDEYGERSVALARVYGHSIYLAECPEGGYWTLTNLVAGNTPNEASHDVAAGVDYDGYPLEHRIGDEKRAMAEFNACVEAAKAWEEEDKKWLEENSRE